MKELNLGINGIQYFGLLSPAASSARGTIVFMHGLGEHIGRYHALFSFFNELGFHCIGTDHFGHGRTPGKRGDVPAFRFFTDEIHALFSYAREELNAEKLLLYGHSLGGNIVLNYLVSQGDKPDYAIVTSPWLRLDTKVSPIQKMLSGLMQRIYPAFTISNGLDPAEISSDAGEVRKYINDPMVHNKISARLFDQASASADKIMQAEITIPLLLMHGTADRITSHTGSVDFAKMNEDFTDLKLFPGMRHELHHETDRVAVFNCIRHWISEKINP